MRMRAVLLVALLVPLLSSPAVGDVYVEEPPDRAYVLVLRGYEVNGARFPETLLMEAFLGETVQMTVFVPPGAEPHTFHLHGHPWFVPSKKAMVDTFLLMPGDVHSFFVEAGGLHRNPGDWMYHCHFDDHVEGGMWGVFRVYPYATRVAARGDGLLVTLDRLGEAVEGATLHVTLDGAPVPAHVRALGEGAYLVHGLAPDASGALVVHAQHALGESVARLSLGEADASAVTLKEHARLPLVGAHH